MTLAGVDASALSTPGNGIGRYLRALLPRLAGAGGDAFRWRWYGREAALPPMHALPRDIDLVVRADGLPSGAGRVLSLASSLPAWAFRDRPDIFWGPAHRLPLLLPRDCARVVTIHDLCWLRAPETMRGATRWLDSTLMPKALRQADRVIAVSQSTHDDLLHHFPRLEGRVTTVLEAADPAEAPATTAASASPGYILFVGTREPRKNLARLIEAYARLDPALRASTRLVIAGASGWDDSSREVAARCGVEDRIEFAGAVDEARLGGLYRGALFLAMPSLYEGFGLPLLEALSHGVPVLYGNNSSMPEVAGDAGLPVDAASIDSIAHGMARLASDGTLRAALASRAKAHAATFSWDRAARETLAVFEAAIAARRAASKAGRES